MHAAYQDILRRIADPPIWWSENGVPRHDPFRPEDCSCIHAQQVVLLRIACAACRQEFDVEICRQQIDRFEDGKHHVDWLLPFEAIAERKLHYGDPPRHGEAPGAFDGCVGDTMNSIPWNSIPLRVLEAWGQDRDRTRREWPHGQKPLRVVRSISTCGIAPRISRVPMQSVDPPTALFIWPKIPREREGRALALGPKGRNGFARGAGSLRRGMRDARKGTRIGGAEEVPGLRPGQQGVGSAEEGGLASRGRPVSGAGVCPGLCGVADGNGAVFMNSAHLMAG